MVVLFAAFLYLRPKPLRLLCDQFGEICVFRIEKGVKGRLMVPCFSGHPGTL